MKGDNTFITHPGFGIYDRTDEIFNTPASGRRGDIRGGCRLRVGFVCKECRKSVLAYKQPKKCEEHE